MTIGESRGALPPGAFWVRETPSLEALLEALDDVFESEPEDEALDDVFESEPESSERLVEVIRSGLLELGLAPDDVAARVDRAVAMSATLPEPRAAERAASIRAMNNARARYGSPTSRCAPFAFDSLEGMLGRGDEQELADNLQISRRHVLRLRRSGLTERQADRYAVRAGLHPSNVWLSWF